MAKKWALAQEDHWMGRVPVGAIRPHPDNPNRGDVAAIADSIETNDWYGTITVQKETGYILAGEHRWRAAKQRGMAEVAVYVRDVGAVEGMRILLVDNELARQGTYDPERIHAVLEKVAEADEDLRGTGFDLQYLEQLEAEREEAEDLAREAAKPAAGNVVPEQADAGISTLYGVIVTMATEKDQERIFGELGKKYGPENLRAVSV